MNKITDLKCVQLTDKEKAYVGIGIAMEQAGEQFIILATDEAALLTAWYRRGAKAPPDFDRCIRAALDHDLPRTPGAIDFTPRFCDAVHFATQLTESSGNGSSLEGDDAGNSDRVKCVGSVVGGY